MKRMRGLTLVELLSAIFALALMGFLGWRGIDGMARSIQGVAADTERIGALEIGLAQWTTDLDALEQIPQAPVLEWNGRLLRLTRRGTTPGEGLRVVAWMLRGGHWARWESAPIASRRELAFAWEDAGLWSLETAVAGGREVEVVPLSAWRLYYFREGAWSHPLSQGDVTEPPVAQEGAQGGMRDPRIATQRQALPDGVRLVLEFPPGQGPQGPVVRDWASPKVLARRS